MRPAEKREHFRRRRPYGITASRGCELMSLPCSTFYDAAPVAASPDDVVTRMRAICDEFECYGYRRLGAALRHQGIVVNGKRLRRLMREHDLQPKRRRRPIFKNLTKGLVVARPNRHTGGLDDAPGLIIAPERLAA
ncbi:IS3 family transposase [Rhodopila sp.]|uniref:IS3 family transposase n=1 Tax=Rhodopila sp. TaxID=2480087 RepID=UPI003D0A3E79